MPVEDEKTTTQPTPAEKGKGKADGTDTNDKDTKKDGEEKLDLPPGTIPLSGCSVELVLS
jgi:hypothetical protein